MYICTPLGTQKGGMKYRTNFNLDTLELAQSHLNRIFHWSPKSSS
jgi:hypothetical protein